MVNTRSGAGGWSSSNPSDMVEDGGLVQANDDSQHQANGMNNHPPLSSSSSYDNNFSVSNNNLPVGNVNNNSNLNINVSVSSESPLEMLLTTLTDLRSLTNNLSVPNVNSIAPSVSETILLFVKILLLLTLM